MTAYADVPQANVAVIIYDSTGYRLIDTNTGLHGGFIDFRPGQTTTVRFRLHALLLKPGTYLVGLQVFRSGIGDMDGIQFAASLTVEQNTAVAQNTEIYPGAYQVAFTHSLLAGEQLPQLDGERGDNLSSLMGAASTLTASG